MNVKHEQSKGSTLYDFIGVGIGPSNLGLAALLSKIQCGTYKLLEQKSQFEWHPGLMFKEATVQVSFLKDLVTMVDPTNPFSFLNFLLQTNRLYRFSNAKRAQIRRTEFNQYFKWVADQLSDHLKFGCEVYNVDWKKDRFIIQSDNGEFHAQHLVLGSGLTPKIPDCAQAHIGPDVFHASEFLFKADDLSKKRITVIGGGQSGAEIVKRVLENRHGIPKQVNWVSSRTNFNPIDDSTFANEYFSPAYSTYFSQLSHQQRLQHLEHQILASDGIDNELLDELYTLINERNDIKPNFCRLIPFSRMIDMRTVDSGWSLQVKQVADSGLLSIDSDVVVLATGFTYQLPSYLDPIASKIPFEDGGFEVNDDYSITWDHGFSNRIYVQNAAVEQKGIADPNLSLSAWRNAKIINGITGTQVYDIERQLEDTVFTFNGYNNSAVPLSDIVGSNGNPL